MELTMRAVAFRRYGPADVLESLVLPRPSVRPDSILIRVAAAAVNPADWRLRDGQFRLAMRLRFPFIPGSDVAGIVESVGPAVSRFQLGDAVYAMIPTMMGGGYAEYVAVSEQYVALAPRHLSLGNTAGVPLAALTALQGLRDRARLQAGQQVLVYGASGGVGSFAVQIAKAMGASVTAATSSRNAVLVQNLGADTVIDYTQHSFSKADQRFDLIFDAVNVLSFRHILPSLNPCGVFVTVNPFIEKLSPGWLASFRRGKRLRSVFVQPGGADLDCLSRWLDVDQIRPLIDQRYPLTDAAEAHRYSATGRVRGKLVLIVNKQLAEIVVAQSTLPIEETSVSL